MAEGRLYVSDGRIMLFSTLTPSGYSFREGGLAPGYSCTCLSADWFNPDKMYAVVNGELYLSSDAGVNWAAGRNFEYAVNEVYANPTVAGEVWVSIDNAYADFSGEGGAWKSTDYGANWTKKLSMTGGLIGDTREAHGVTAYGLNVWVSLGDSVYDYTQLLKSTDGGDNWSTVSPGSGRVGWHSQAAKATKGAFWYLGLADGPHITTDNWATKTNRAATIGTGIGVMYDPTGTYLLATKAGEIHRSTNDGATWTNVGGSSNAQLLSSSRYLLAWKPETTKVYHGGSVGYIYYSSDSGVTWNSFQTDRATTIKCLLGTAPVSTANLAFKLVVA